MIVIQKNLDKFYEQLKIEYENLFKNDPEYVYSVSKTTSADLVRKMSLGLDNGSANKDGEGIKRICKYFGIFYVYKVIRVFFQVE